MTTGHGRRSRYVMDMAQGSGKNSLGDHRISKRLKSYYDSVQEETIPDRFLDLLEKLDEAEKKAKQSDDTKKESGGE